MKKKMIALLVGVCAAATLVACGNKGISNDKIKITQYKGLEVSEQVAAEVSDSDIEYSINSTLQTKSTETEITDRAVQEGDVAKIDYVGKKDGVEFEGGSATDYDLEIGSDSFIDGFEDGIIGHNIGETFDLNLKFPEEYKNNPDLAGADVVFTVTVKGIKVVNVPELTDELVKEFSETAKTVDEYREEVKKNLQESNEQAAQSTFESNVWMALIDNCTLDKYPKEDEEQIRTDIDSQYSSIASMYGVDVDTFIQQAFGVTADEMTTRMLKQKYAIELISEKEKLEVSDKDYEEGLAKFAEQYGYDDTAEFEEAIGKENLQDVILQQKVGDFLKDNCKIVKKEATDKK